MKINPFRHVDMNAYKRQMTKVEQPQTTEKKDKVEISSEAKEMMQVSSVVKEREARIAELKNQVQSGNYKPDPNAIAKGITNFYK